MLVKTVKHFFKDYIITDETGNNKDNINNYWFSNLYWLCLKLIYVL